MNILKTARIAELAGFGKIAEDRVKVIGRVEELKNDRQTIEAAYQELITEAPWLINPGWQPLIQNQSFSTLKKAFQTYYKSVTGQDLLLDDFSDPGKRCDFVLSNQDNAIEIIEIKRPGHKLQNDEMVRIDNYVRLMRQFLDDPGNQRFKSLYPEFHVTLVCDELGLSGVNKTAFEGLKRDGTLLYERWDVFLGKARQAHQDFLQEAERQKKIAVTK